MDYRALSAVLIKTGGTFMLVYALLTFSEALVGIIVFAPPDRSIALLALLAPVVTGILGILLLRYPYSLVNRWIVPPKPGEPPVDIAAVEQVVYAGIGLAVIVMALQPASQWLVVLLNNPDLLDQADQRAMFKSSLLQLLLSGALGVGLMLGARGLVGLRRRLRDR